MASAENCRLKSARQPVPFSSRETPRVTDVQKYSSINNHTGIHNKHKKERLALPCSHRVEGAAESRTLVFLCGFLAPRTCERCERYRAHGFDTTQNIERRVSVK